MYQKAPYCFAKVTPPLPTFPMENLEPDRANPTREGMRANNAFSIIRGHPSTFFS